MRQFREPFSVETAEGFPVDGIHMSSRSHAHHAEDLPGKSEMKKIREKKSNRPKQEGRT